MTEVSKNRVLPESEGNVLCVEVAGKVTLAGYDKNYVPELERICRDYGELRLLCSYVDPDNFPGWEEKAAEKDLEKFTKHGHKVKKVALVNAPAKAALKWETIGAMGGGEVRKFKEGEFQEALAWVKAA